MSGTKILWGQIVLVLSLIVLSWWVATEWTAWELAFQPELGRPWFVLFHRWPVYAPPLFFWWWYVFDAYAPNVFARGAWIAGSGGVLAFTSINDLSIDIDARIFGRPQGRRPDDHRGLSDMGL